MKAYYTVGQSNKRRRRPGAGAASLEDFADYSFRFHGKGIVQISMYPINHFRINVGNYKPYLTLQNDRLQSATGKKRAQGTGIGPCRRQELVFDPEQMKMLKI